MKILLTFIFLLISVSCYGNEIDLQKMDVKESIINSYQTNKDREKNGTYRHGQILYDDKYVEEYVGNPDFDAKIKRPCLVYDLNCIRKYFADHSKCKIRRGPLPSTLFISEETVYYSRINTSVVLNNYQVEGFRNTRIEEFYINRRTNKIVFSIQIRLFGNILPTSYFIFYRNGREPIVTLTNAFDFFPSVTYTAIIPINNGIRLEKAEITPYADSIPAFYINPEVFSSPDPTVIQAMTEFLAEVPTLTQERLLTNSYILLPDYIQSNICDFGLKRN